MTRALPRFSNIKAAATQTAIQILPVRQVRIRRKPILMIQIIIYPLRPTCIFRRQICCQPFSKCIHNYLLGTHFAPVPRERLTGTNLSPPRLVYFARASKLTKNITCICTNCQSVLKIFVNFCKKLGSMRPVFRRLFSRSPDQVMSIHTE